MNYFNYLSILIVPEYSLKQASLHQCLRMTYFDKTSANAVGTRTV